MRKTLSVAAALAMLTLFSVAALANTPPAAVFAAYRLASESDATVLFDASASTDSDGQIKTFQWVFGDGTTGSGMQIEHAFPSVGRYTVTLMAFDDAGGWHMVSRTVDISILPLGGPDSLQAESPPPAPAVPIGNRVGQRAPDFTLPDVNGGFVNLSDFRERVVLLEFWLSTCPGCIASLPHLEILREEFADRGFVVLLVSLDATPRDAIRYLSSNGYEDFLVVHETRPITLGTGAAYGVFTTPHAFLIDRSGIIRQTGYPSVITSETIAGWL